MKTFKRTIASFVAVLMIMSVCLLPNVFGAENTGVSSDVPTFTDVTPDQQYGQAIYDLAKYGIINGIEQADGTFMFKPDDVITRAEFAKLLAVSIVGDVPLNVTTTRFPDLAEDYWANPYIAYCVNAGIINGCEDGTFRPANPVTYGEALKMLVCSKGGQSVYQPTIPWYEGYITLGNQMGITKGAQALGDSPAPRGLVAQLVYNHRDVKYIQQESPSVGGGGGRPTVGGSADEDFEEEDGIVVAVAQTTLTGNKEDEVANNEIKIDDVVYKLDLKKYTPEKLYKYIGYRVDIEYSEKASGKKTIERIQSSSKNEAVEIDARDLYSIDGNAVTYYPVGENKAETATLAETINVIYNGVAVAEEEITPEFIDEYFNIENGEITLLSNNTSREYEVAFVESYDTYFVSSRRNDGKVYTVVDTYAGTKIDLNEDDCTVYTKSQVGGTLSEGKMTAISVNTVLSVAVPYDRTEGTTVIVSTAKVQNGEVDSVSKDTVTINGKEYFESPYIKDLIQKDEKEYGYKTADKGAFYFDYAGNLAFFAKAPNSDPYAYVLGYDDGKGLNGIPSIHLLMISSSGVTSKVFAFKETVKVNGTNKEPYELANILKANAEVINAKSVANKAKIENGEYSQLIRYKYTTSGGISYLTEVYTIDTDDFDDGEVVPGEFRYKKPVEVAEGETPDPATVKSPFTDGKNKLSYVSSSKAFTDSGSSNQFIINSSTLVLLVPDDRSDVTEYKKKTNTYFSNGSKYDVEPYNIKNNIASVLLVYTRGASTAATVSANTNVAFVEYIDEDVENDKGKDVDQVTYYSAGSTTTVNPKPLTKDDNILDGIQAGDIVKFAVEDGVIVNVQKVFVGGVLYDWTGSGQTVFDTFPAEGNFIQHSYGSTTDYYQVIHGTVEFDNISSGVGELGVVPAIVTKNEDYDNSDWKSYSITTATKFYKWDEDNDKFVLEDEYAIFSAQELEGDAVGASKVVVIKIGTTVKAVYILG